MNNIIELIGNTPVVEINKLNPNKKVRVFAKLEGYNPGGSVKDRIALSMIEAAEKSGELTLDKVILEPTSGNTGIGLAMVAAIKGCKTVLVMSNGMSEERKQMLYAFGAEIVQTDPELGTDGAIKKAHEMLTENPEKYWMPNQFDNKANILAHYNGTAVEIIEGVPEITHFVAGMGTSGTLMGTGKRLREYNPEVKIIGIEPEPLHAIQGLKNMGEAIVPGIYEENKLDWKIEVRTEDAYETARQLALQEGIFVGMSSGAAMYGAMNVANSLNKGTIVVIFPDGGEKYLSTPLFR